MHAAAAYSWVATCGSVGIRLQLPAGATMDAAGDASAPSQALHLLWYPGPPVLATCPSPPPTEKFAYLLDFSMELPALNLSMLNGSALFGFEARFRQLVAEAAECVSHLPMSPCP